MEIKVIDNIKLTKSLGKGSYGEVFLTEIIGKEGLYATKMMDRSYYEREENIKRLYNEITILKEIKHPNIVNYIFSKKTKDHIYIVMEYCNGGSLSDCLGKYTAKFKRLFNERIVQYLMKQIIKGLNEFHSKNILHRDLKLDNILINFPSEQDKEELNMLSASVKISDFGFSSILKDDKAFAKTNIGTPIYKPPEMIDALVNNKNIQYRTKADIWSCGNNMKDIDKKIKEGIYRLPMYLSHESVLFISSMIQANPDKRLNCEELLKRDFLNKDISQFQKIKKENIPGIIEQKNNILFISILDKQ